MVRFHTYGRPRRITTTCTCAAYKFPHRAGTGKCRWFDGAVWCWHCQQWAELIRGDTDTYQEWVTQCCNCLDDGTKTEQHQPQ